MRGTQVLGFVLALAACRQDVGVKQSSLCDGIAQPSEDYVDAPYDLDGDGYYDADIAACAEAWPADRLDCDDLNPEIHPTALEEACDGIDNDCDGLTDLDDDDAEGGYTFHHDDDGDGFGDPDATFLACTADGGATDASDCDDSRADRFPGAEELCNGADDDCDGETDEDDATDTSPWYRDADVDGFGDPDDVTWSCTRPAGHVDNDLDCDDDTFTTHLGADERCNGVDDDCDGRTDEDDAVDATTWYSDLDADGFGDANAPLQSCEDPGRASLDDTDCDDGDATVYPGAPEVCDDGQVNDCLGDATSAALECRPYGESYMADAQTRVLGEHAGDGAGLSLAAVGDLDGDGRDEFFVGAPYEDAGGADAGAAYLVAGGTTGTTSLSAAAAKLIGEAAGDYAGTELAGAGDVNGDGVPDLFVGAYLADAGGTNAGAAYLVHGPVTGTTSLSSANARIWGEAAFDYASRSLAGPGDVNGDGYADLLIGALFADAGGSNAGAAYLVFGPVSGDVDLADANAKLYGSADFDRAGATVSGAGDLNGDGLADVLVGAPREDTGGTDAGAVYVVLGAPTGTRSLDDADAMLVGVGAVDYAGTALAAAGDVDADGYDDVLVGAYLNDDAGQDAGAAYLVRGPIAGVVDLANADAVMRGEVAGDQAGSAVGAAGDVNQDGFADMLVGAPYESTVSSHSGAAYVVLGPLQGSVDLGVSEARARGEFANDEAGARVSGPLDGQNNGVPDLLAGAPGHDGGGTDAGAAYLLWGQGI